jgi:hypothetical protein
MMDLRLVLALALALGCGDDTEPEPDAYVWPCEPGAWCGCPHLGPAYPGHIECRPWETCVCLDCRPGEERWVYCGPDLAWTEHCTSQGVWTDLGECP